MSNRKSIRLGFVVGAIIGAVAALIIISLMALELEPTVDAGMIVGIVFEVVTISTLVGLVGAGIAAAGDRIRPSPKNRD